MPYDRLTPTLNALSPEAGKPDGASESVAILDDALRQTRYFMLDFLTLYFDAAGGGLKPGAFGAASIPAGSVRGSNGATQREILQGSVTTLELAASAVTAEKIAAAAVDSLQLKDGAVTETKLASGSITGSKLRSKSISAVQIADGAISESLLASGAVTAAKVARNAVTSNALADGACIGRKIVPAGEGYILVGGNNEDGSGSGNWVYPRRLGPNWVLDRMGNLSLAAGTGTAYVVFQEVAVAGTDGNGGASLTVGWNRRGRRLPWVATAKGAQDLVIPSQSPNEGFRFQQPGTYMIVGHFPGYRCGEFRARARFYPTGDTTGMYDDYYSTNGYSPSLVNSTVGPTYSSVMGTCMVQFVITVGEGEKGVKPLLIVEQYSGVTNSYAFGIASTAGGGSEQERYSSVFILKLS